MVKLSQDKINNIMKCIESKPLTPTSHLYKRYPEKLIGQAAEEFYTIYSEEAENRPGLVLLSVVLSIHTSYTSVVEPQIDRLRKTKLSKISDLAIITRDFSTFSNVVGIKAENKYIILKTLIEAISELKSEYSINDDYKVLNKWALSADPYNYQNDIIGRISGIGPATFQHLRMNFGADTVKPDQRVKEVLNREFNVENSDNDFEAIEAVKCIADITGRSVLYIDQVFVNYGSGYYTEKDDIMKDKNIQHNKAQENFNSRVNNRAISEHVNELEIQKMIDYLSEAIKDLDISNEKRNDNATIIIANQLAHKRTKNIFTYWVSSKSVSVIILRMMDKRCFNSVEEMEQINLKEMIRSKFNSMV